MWSCFLCPASGLRWCPGGGGSLTAPRQPLRLCEERRGRKDPGGQCLTGLDLDLVGTGAVVLPGAHRPRPPGSGGTALSRSPATCAVPDTDAVLSLEFGGHRFHPALCLVTWRGRKRGQRVTWTWTGCGPQSPRLQPWAVSELLPVLPGGDGSEGHLERLTGQVCWPHSPQGKSSGGRVRRPSQQFTPRTHPQVGLSNTRSTCRQVRPRGCSRAQRAGGSRFPGLWPLLREAGPRSQRSPLCAVSVMQPSWAGGRSPAAAAGFTAPPGGRGSLGWGS